MDVIYDVSSLREQVSRRTEEKHAPLEASMDAMDQIFLKVHGKHARLGCQCGLESTINTDLFRA